MDRNTVNLTHSKLQTLVSTARLCSLSRLLVHLLRLLSLDYELRVLSYGMQGSWTSVGVVSSYSTLLLDSWVLRILFLISPCDRRWYSSLSWSTCAMNLQCGKVEDVWVRWMPDLPVVSLDLTANSKRLYEFHCFWIEVFAFLARTLYFKSAGIDAISVDENVRFEYHRLIWEKEAVAWPGLRSRVKLHPFLNF